MISRISLLLLFLASAPAAFIYFRKLRGVAGRRMKALFFLPNVVLLALCACFMACESDLAAVADEAGVFLIAFLLVTVPELVYSVVLAASLPFKGKRAGRIFSRLGVALSALSALLVVMGYVSCYAVIKVGKHEFVSPDLPRSFDGYRIIHVSDLHLGTYHLYPKTVERIVREINGQGGDVICFTGDLVNFSQKEIRQFAGLLGELKAPDGVFSVLGNHDYLNYVRYSDSSAWRSGFKELKKLQRAAGWRLLLNENRVIRRGGDSIFIAGSENDGLPPFPARGNLREALKGAPRNAFKILLSHDPTQWRRKVLPETDIQLTLSGHTHAGQVKILGRSPSSFVYGEWDGMYVREGRALSVSAGVGEALIPFRLGAWPEIDVITLRTSR